MAVRSIVATHMREGLAVYVIGDLPELEALPHVAGVASMKDAERTRRIVDEVTGLLDHPRPVMLVVDGWHALDEDLREPLARIASEGPDAGIHLVVTTQRWSAIRPNVRDLIGTRLELRLAEPMDSLINRKHQEKLPATPGRGLTPDGKTVQLAFTSGEDIAHLATTADQAPVDRLRVLPEGVDTQSLLDGQRIPLGIGGPALEPVYASGHILVVGAGGCGKSTFIASTITAVEHMGREAARMVVLDPKRAHLGRADENMVAAYAASTSAITQAAKSLAVTLQSRLPGAEVTPEQLRERSWWSGPELYLIIDDYELVGEEPLRPIAELLPHARDIGLHVVAARKFGGVSRALFGPFLTALKDLQPDVLLMDGTRDEGAIFGVRPSPQQPGRATWINGEARGTVQLPEAQ